jgi:hypothetical protein
MHIEKIRENDIGLLIDVTTIDIFKGSGFILDDDSRFPRFRNMAKRIVDEHFPKFKGKLVQVYVSEYLYYYTRYSLLLLKDKNED